ncbi:hypothetical protein IEA_05674 [Bacillus toyonensis]|nr:hypothetical protein IEA_05674 [Bacillus toyonensis]
MSELIFEVTFIDDKGNKCTRQITALNETSAMTYTTLIYYATKILKVVEIR